MATRSERDHFSDVSAEYATFRPHYPDTLFEWLASVTPEHGAAWDCATGSGQAALSLADRFELVYASDASVSQLRHAIPHMRVHYFVSAAEAVALPAGSACLVSAAQALHWFDWRAFFDEARRVLKPRGVLAFWTYGLMETDPDVQPIVSRFYTEALGGYWPPERRIVEEAYQPVESPAGFEELAPPPMTIEVHWTLRQLIGYIGTWSGLYQYREQTGDDPLPDVSLALGARWGDPETKRPISWRLVLRAARRS